MNENGLFMNKRHHIFVAPSVCHIKCIFKPVNVFRHGDVSGINEYIVCIDRSVSSMVARIISLPIDDFFWIDNAARRGRGHILIDCLEYFERER